MKAIDGMLASSGLDEPIKSAYRRSIEAVVRQMPDKALAVLAAKAKKIMFVASEKDATSQWAKMAGVSSQDAEEIGMVKGFYNPRELSLCLDGASDLHDSPGVYSHEMAHAIDYTEGGVVSDSDAWRDAYEQEIDTDGVPLSQYARTNASEGFAEFVRLAYQNPKAAREQFPKSWAVLESVGYAPTSDAKMEDPHPLSYAEQMARAASIDDSMLSDELRAERKKRSSQDMYREMQKRLSVRTPKKPAWM